MSTIYSVSRINCWATQRNFLLFLGIVLSFLLLLETYAHQKMSVREQKNADPFQASLHTHDGMKISPHRGPLKIALSPYTIYRNLPLQETPWFTVDAWGLRAGCGENVRGSSPHRKIILLGGSAAFGLRVHDQQTVACNLEQFLREEEPRSEVMNAGVVGFDSTQEFIYLVTQGADHEPETVITYSGWNDLYPRWDWNLREGNQDRDPLFFMPVFFVIEDRLVETYQSRTQVLENLRRSFMALVSRSASLFRFQDSLGLGPTQKKLSPALPPGQWERAVERYARNLKKMNDFCESRGVRFLAVIQPELGQKRRPAKTEAFLFEGWERAMRREYAPEFPRLYRSFVEQTKDRLRKMGVPFLDVNAAPEFKDHPGPLFLDVVHLNPRGNKIVARLIHRKLKRAQNGISTRSVFPEEIERSGGSNPFSPKALQSKG